LRRRRRGTALVVDFVPVPSTVEEEEEERDCIGSYFQPKNKLVFVPVPVAGEELE
jgi:hypothetical protein